MTTTQSEAQSTYRLLKTDLAAKLGLRATGGITYQLLADAEGKANKANNWGQSKVK